MNGFDWGDIRYFLAVADHGSLSAAARRLGSNQPTVGRHIGALEAALGMTLFQRMPGGLVPTQDGAMLLEAAQRVRRDMLDIDRLAGGRLRQPGGQVCLALPEGICNELIVPALHRFYEKYPRIRLLLNVSPRAAKLNRGEADVAIRLFRPNEPDLVVRELGELEMGLFAADGYLTRYPAPVSEAELADHFVIAYGDGLADRPENLWLTKRAATERIVLRSDSTTTRWGATEAGLGISVQPKRLVRGKAGICGLLERSAIPGYSIWLVYHRDLRRVAAVRAVIDFVSGLFDERKGPAPDA